MTNIFKYSLTTLISTSILVLLGVNFYIYMVSIYGTDADFLNVVYVSADELENSYFGFRSLLSMIRFLPTDSFINTFVYDIKKLVSLSLLGIPDIFRVAFQDGFINTSEIIKQGIVQIVVLFLADPILIFFGLFITFCDFLSFFIQVLAVIEMAFGGYFNITHESPYPFEYVSYLLV